jgi:putative flippase GtrA
VNIFIRWCKFNLVGAIGMVVQLGALALFNQWSAGHYLYASAAAVELTLLHNFVWHLHYTWRDRRDDSVLLAQLIRFHLSNGLVSMLGNLALMQILVHQAHIPLLTANGIAILCCSIVNFSLGNQWAFSTPPVRPIARHLAVRLAARYSLTSASVSKSESACVSEFH